MENLPTPLSRVELYLAKACGMDVTVPEKPLSRLEQFLAIIAGDTSIPMPTPMSLTEQWLAYVLGVTPDPLLVVEGACLIGAQKVDVRYFAVAASMPGATLPDAPQNRAEMYWAHIAVNPPTPGILKYVTGTSIHLTDVVSGIEELQYVKGDTFQQTCSGKNLLHGDYTGGLRQGIDSTWNNAYVTFSGETTTSYANLTQGSIGMPLSPGAYTFSRDKTSAQYAANIRLVYGGSQYTFAIPKNETSISFTIPEDATDGVLNLIFISGLSAGLEISDTIGLMLESGSSASPFEPYTGSIPAPNPDYPQPIQVVTGEQTVNISDGGTSHDYTLDLGAIELCKIGTYQDYIYQSNSNWYVHKTLGKYTFDGSETIAYNSSNKGFTINSNILTNYMPNLATPPMVGLSTHFLVNSTTSTWVGDNRIGLSSAGTFWCKATSFATSQADCETWLTDNTPTIYYGLATPTDTQITDATLISQLDAINSATLPKPVASITIGATGTNLEAILTIAYYGSDE